MYTVSEFHKTVNLHWYWRWKTKAFNSIVVEMYVIETTNNAKYSNCNCGDTVSAAGLICRPTVKFHFSRSFIRSDTQPHLTIPEIANRYAISK
jgi:hypothetical protein